MNKADVRARVAEIIDAPSYLTNKAGAARALAEAVVWLLDRTPTDEELEEMAKEGE